MQSTVDLAELIVTQNGLRNCRQVENMIRFVKAGGRFTKDARLAQSLLAETGRGIPPPIHIAVMEDGQMVLHDGHHRAVALFLAGRSYIDPEEYEMAKYTYADYTELHPEKGWFTPFDIHTQVRKPEFGPYKKAAIFHYTIGGSKAFEEFFYRGRYGTVFTSMNLPVPADERPIPTFDYVEPRRIRTVSELAQEYQKVCPYDAEPRRRVG